MAIADIRWMAFEHHDDDRGTLTALEGSVLPFEIRRIFYMHRVPSGHDRGGHAHRYSQQCLIAVTGCFAVEASDGAKTQTFVLDDPNRGLYLPAMTWVWLHGFESGTVALVLCDTEYAPQHVIRSLEEYRRAQGEPS